MKNLAQNIFWVIIVSLVVFIILSKLEKNNSICTISIQSIDEKLKSGEEFTYESNEN